MIHVDCILQNPKFSPTFSLENDFVKSYANVKGSVHSAGPNELSQPRFTCDISLKSSPVLPHGKKKKSHMHKCQFNYPAQLVQGCPHQKPSWQKRRTHILCHTALNRVAVICSDSKVTPQNKKCSAPSKTVEKG